MKTIEDRLAERARQRAIEDAKALSARIRDVLSNDVKIFVVANKAVQASENGQMLKVQIDPYRLITAIQEQVVSDLTTAYTAEERTEFLRKVDDLEGIISDRVQEQIQRG